MVWDLLWSLRLLPHPLPFHPPQDRSQPRGPRPVKWSRHPTQPTELLASLHLFPHLVLRSLLQRPMWPPSRPMPRPIPRRLRSSTRSCSSNSISNLFNHHGDPPTPNGVVRLHRQVTCAYSVVVLILWTFVLCSVSCLLKRGDSFS